MTHQIEPYTDPNHPYYKRLCALLEPDAIEYARTGTFTYAVGANETKYLLFGQNMYFDPNTNARYDVRKPRNPLPLRNVTLKGAGSDSMGIFLDPSKPSYSNARDLYFERLRLLSQLPFKYAHSSTRDLLLPGAYGSIVTSSVIFDATPAGVRFATNTGLVLSTDYARPSGTTRFQHTMFMPITRAFVRAVYAHLITYVDLPANWSKIPDPLAPYLWRDDFSGATLDTATKWTRTQSTVGNVEIDPNYPWVKMLGNGTWGANGAYAQQGFSRASQPTLVIDAVPREDNFIVGWSTGAGHSYANFAHCVDFSGASLFVFENGTNRGTVGSGWSGGAQAYTYRIRIKVLSGGGATYEIQGGTQYPAIGGPTWTNITPATSSSATSTVYPGFTIQDAASFPAYVGDVRVY